MQVKRINDLLMHVLAGRWARQPIIWNPARQAFSVTDPDNLNKASAHAGPHPPKGSIPNLTVDNLIFGLENGVLKVLLIRHRIEGEWKPWALPGGWIHYDEDLRDAAKRILQLHTGVKGVYLEQLKTFGKADRLPFGRVVTVAYYALVSTEKCPLIAHDDRPDAMWCDIHEVPRLAYDHNEILDFGLDFLRHKIRHEPVGFNLLPEKFTLLELQELYEAILDCKLDKPNFRRKMLKMNLLEPCNEKQTGVAHRAASLYRFDAVAFEKLTAQGFSFEV